MAVNLYLVAQPKADSADQTTEHEVAVEVVVVGTVSFNFHSDHRPVLQVELGPMEAQLPECTEVQEQLAATASGSTTVETVVTAAMQEVQGELDSVEQ